MSLVTKVLGDPNKREIRRHSAVVEEINRFGEIMQATESANWIAQAFINYGHPLFNEAAYKVLVNQGHQERADRFFYNQPDKALETNLKGPSKNEQAYVDAFNEVFA